MINHLRIIILSQILLIIGGKFNYDMSIYEKKLYYNILHISNLITITIFLPYIVSLFKLKEKKLTINILILIFLIFLFYIKKENILYTLSVYTYILIYITYLIFKIKWIDENDLKNEIPFLYFFKINSIKELIVIFSSLILINYFLI